MHHALRPKMVIISVHALAIGWEPHKILLNITKRIDRVGAGDDEHLNQLCTSAFRGLSVSCWLSELFPVSLKGWTA